MLDEVYEIGIRQLDEALGGGLPAGSVTTILGPPGTFKEDIALRFISHGFEKGEPGLFVSFTSVPISSFLKRLKGKERYMALLETDEPIFLNTNDLKGLDIVLNIIEEGSLGRLVLDRPDVLQKRDISNWFKGLEDILDRARTIGMATLVIGSSSYLDIADYTSEGIIELPTVEGGRRTALIRKWPYGPLGRVTELEVGEWTG